MLLVNGANNLVLKERPLDELSSMGGRGIVVMMFKDVQCEDSADYRCEVDNGVGLSTIRLLVPCRYLLKSMRCDQKKKLRSLDRFIFY